MVSKMKKHKTHIIFLYILFFFSIKCIAQPQANCSGASTGFPPINDLGKGTWNGFQGGLYPNGSNVRPRYHDSVGVFLSNQIAPLNENGNIDKLNGKVGFISIGMSNTNQEFYWLKFLVDSLKQSLNPSLKLANCAQGGFDIDSLAILSSGYWPFVDKYLRQASLTNQQVQVVWLKTAKLIPSNDLAHIDTLKLKLTKVLQNLKSKFPNLKICYLSSRIYAGYTTRKGNPEPYAYYSGWAIKKIVEAQINGEPDLIYNGKSSKAPWICWGPYLWADGIKPRSDGLVWSCPVDFAPDGTHPSKIGAQKVSKLLFNFFSSDSTSINWFLNK